MRTKTIPTARQNLNGLVAIILDETASAFEKQCARQNISCFSEQERKEAFAAKQTKTTHSPGPWTVDDKHVHCASGGRMSKAAFKIREFTDPVRLLPTVYPSFEEAEKAFDGFGGLSRHPSIQIVQADGEAIEIVRTTP